MKGKTQLPQFPLLVEFEDGDDVDDDGVVLDIVVMKVTPADN